MPRGLLGVLIFLLVSVSVARAQGDIVLMRIGETQVSKSEFEYYFNRSNCNLPKEFLEDFIAYKAKALYAKDLGLPFDRVICTFTANSAMWDFVNKGILHTASEEIPRYLECYIHRKFGREQVTCYQDAVSAKTGFLLEEEKMNLLRQELFAAVVSANRAESIRSSFASTNHYSITFDAAVSYGGLQDYRASSGISKDTLILVKKFTDSAKE